MSVNTSMIVAFVTYNSKKSIVFVSDTLVTNFNSPLEDTKEYYRIRQRHNINFYNSPDMLNFFGNHTHSIEAEKIQKLNSVVKFDGFEVYIGFCGLNCLVELENILSSNFSDTINAKESDLFDCIKQSITQQFSLTENLYNNEHDELGMRAYLKSIDVSVAIVVIVPTSRIKASAYAVKKDNIEPILQFNAFGIGTSEVNQMFNSYILGYNVHSSGSPGELKLNKKQIEMFMTGAINAAHDSADNSSKYFVNNIYKGLILCERKKAIPITNTQSWYVAWVKRIWRIFKLVLAKEHHIRVYAINKS